MEFNSYHHHFCYAADVFLNALYAEGAAPSWETKSARQSAEMAFNALGCMAIWYKCGRMPDEEEVFSETVTEYLTLRLEHCYQELSLGWITRKQAQHVWLNVEPYVAPISPRMQAYRRQVFAKD